MAERPLLPVAEHWLPTSPDNNDDKGTTTTTANDLSPTSSIVIDLLMSLPVNLVVNYIYPFAVQVIQNREELIAAVDEYLDEHYSDGEEKNEDEDIGNNRIRYPIGDWDVSRVGDFTSVFDVERNGKAENFNEDLSRWNVANATSFARMFAGCHVFQSDLSNWNTGRATNLSDMFEDCTSFQSDLSRWNVANATNLYGMFSCCESFNADLSRWNVANATDLSYMFHWCTSFNSDLSRWNVANATDLNGMFHHCGSFNSDLSRWNVANATNFAAMFCQCTSFNSDLSRWNVANATDFSFMFDGCTSFNSDVSRWDVTNAVRWDRLLMFRDCDSFDRTFVATWPPPYHSLFYDESVLLRRNP
jgi:surface protein